MRTTRYWMSFILVTVILPLVFAQKQSNPTQNQRTDEPGQPVTRAPRQPEGAPQWSGTTREAAGTEQQKAWLDQGKAQTVTGEVVDVSCYLQLGKTGEKHADCGAKCVRNGQPIGLLTSSKELYLVIPEEHHPRRDGKVDIREQFAQQMGKQVTLTGIVQNTPQGKAIFVSSLKVDKD